MMLKLTATFALLAIGAAIACSDDDGSDVQPKGSGTGGSAGDGMSGSAGSSQSGSAGDGGGGMSGSGGAGGSSGSAGGPPGCTPSDAGAPDAGDGDAGIADASTDGGISGVVSFAADIHPIFVASCGPCHVQDNSGGHNVGAADVDAAYADAVEYSASILERTNGGGMPPSFAAPPNNCADGDGPGDPGCLSVEEYNLIQTWVAQCYPR